MNKQVDLRWYVYSQNNSGGRYSLPAKYVSIQAVNYRHANSIACEHDIYFDGVARGSDCACCGDRWDEKDSYDDKRDDQDHWHPYGDCTDRFLTNWDSREEKVPWLIVVPFNEDPIVYQKPFYKKDGSIPFDLLVAGEYESFVSLLGPGEARRVAPPKLSEEARASRSPRPPEELVGALQDRIHPTSGRLLAAKPIATTRRK